jgi:hypothetical protein
MTRLCHWKLTVAVAAIGLLGLAKGQANAGLISINTTTLSSTGAEIPTNLPVVVHAWNVNGNAVTPPIVNGIAFSNTQPSPITLSAAFNAFVSNDATTGAHYSGAMVEIMNDMAGTASVTNGLVTISDLIVGQLYSVTFLHHQDINDASQRDMEVHFGSLSSNPGGGAVGVGNNQGYLTIARFTADAPSQNFLFRVGGNDRAILNAVLVQTVPEPGSILAWGLSALVFGCAGYVLRQRSTVRS